MKKSELLIIAKAIEMISDAAKVESDFIVDTLRGLAWHDKDAALIKNQIAGDPNCPHSDGVRQFEGDEFCRRCGKLID